MSCWRQRPKYIRYLSIGEYLGGSTSTAATRTAIFGPKNKALAAQMSGSADEALEVLPPKDVGFSNSVASGGGQVTVEMLGGPEETLG